MDAEDIQPGTASGELPGTIEHYRILDRLGLGGMGQVYLAEDPRAGGRRVAIKTLAVSEFLSPDQQESLRRRLREEASALGRIDHPAVPTLYHVIERKSVFYLVMEYVEGRTLADLAAEDRKISAARAVEIGIEVLGALAAAHAEGLVHRDVKPSNIMLTEDGQVKLIDFGLAKQTGFSVPITRTNASPGTPGYMSPEQISGQDATPASDLFCLGIVLYELLSGQRPFQGQSETALAFSILYEAPPNIRDHAPRISKPLADVVRRALAKDPADRFETAEAMAYALRCVPCASPGGRAAPRAAAVQAAAGKKAEPALAAEAPPKKSSRAVPFAIATCIAALGAAVILWAALRVDRNLNSSAPSYDGKIAARSGGESNIQPDKQPAQPDKKPAEPDKEPVGPAKEPAERGKKPVEPVERPAEPGNEPAEPAEDPVEPGREPVEPVEQPKPAPDKPGPKPKPRPEFNKHLRAAVMSGDEDRVAWLLDRGAEVDSPHPGNTHPGATIRHRLTGYTPLRLAYEKGHRDVVKLLLKRGANPDAVPSTGGCTLLHLAAKAGDIEMARLLLAHGADIEATHKAHPHAPIADNYRGYTALRYAYDADQMEMVKFLLSAGANVDVVPWRSGHTLLHLAAKNGDAEFVKLLLSHGADASIKSGGRPHRTALDYAVAGGHNQVAEILMHPERYRKGRAEAAKNEPTTKPSEESE